MIYEITQIKRWLAKKFKLRTEGSGGDLKIIDPVPNGRYMIPIGRRPRKLPVVIQDGGISIDP